MNISDNGNSVYFNRYAYVGGDPVNAWDPTGMIIKIVGSSKFKEQVQKDLDDVRNESEEGASAIERLEKKDVKVVIFEPGHKDSRRYEKFFPAGSTGNKTFQNKKSGRVGLTNYNPGDSFIRYARTANGGIDVEGNTSGPASVGLGHEIGHAFTHKVGFDFGVFLRHFYPNVPTKEIYPLHIENQMRKNLGVPLRVTY